MTNVNESYTWNTAPPTLPGYYWVRKTFEPVLKNFANDTRSIVFIDLHHLRDGSFMYLGCTESMKLFDFCLIPTPSEPEE